MNLDNITLETPYLSLDEEFYTLTDPAPLDEPYLISYSPEAAKLIGLDSSSCEDPPGAREGAAGKLYLAYLRDPSGNKLCALHRLA